MHKKLWLLCFLTVSLNTEALAETPITNLNHQCLSEAKVMENLQSYSNSCPTTPGWNITDPSDEGLPDASGLAWFRDSKSYACVTKVTSVKFARIIYNEGPNIIACDYLVNNGTSIDHTIVVLAHNVPQDISTLLKNHYTDIKNYQYECGSNDGSVPISSCSFHL